MPPEGAGYAFSRKFKVLMVGGSNQSSSSAINMSNSLELQRRWRLTEGLGYKLIASYPLTLIFEKDSTARPEIGRPIEVAGRKVVKINAFLTSDDKLLDSSLLESTR